MNIYEYKIADTSPVVGTVPKVGIPAVDIIKTAATGSLITPAGTSPVVGTASKAAEVNDGIKGDEPCILNV